MIIVTGSILARPETREQIMAEGITHSVRSRAEPGCIAHNVHWDGENPDRLVFVELWADAAALKVHFAVPESGAFVRAAGALAAAAPEMQIYEGSEISPSSL